ncbi:MAG: glycosyltransferase family 39 protein [bacterium]|nr:glycosyltransferase family 39 protein [bacterium]
MQSFFCIIKSRPILLYVLIAELLLFLLLNIAWEYESCFFLYHEAFIHALNVQTIYYDFDNMIFRCGGVYPVFVPLAAKWLLYVFTDEKWAFFAFQISCVFINVIATYFSALKLNGDKCAFWSASALLWLPSSVFACREFVLDYPLACMVSLWFLCYLYSNRLKSSLLQVLLIILFVMMFATKYSAILYFFPVALAVFYDLRRDKAALLRFVLLLAESLLCVIGIYLLFVNMKGVVWSAGENIALRTRNFLYLVLDPQCASLFFRGFLVDIKAKILTPCVFYCFAYSSVVICLFPKLRRKFLFVVFPCSLSAFFVFCTPDSLRYHFPLLSFFCIVAGIGLKKLLWLRTISIIAIIAQGLSISGGWLLPCPPKACNEYFLYSELDISALYGGTGADCEEVSYYAPGKVKIAFSRANTLYNLVNFRSSWSDSFFYTIYPYRMDWRKELDFLFTLPANSTVSVTGREFADEPIIMILPHHFCFWASYYSMKEDRKLLFKDEFSDKADYILQIEPESGLSASSIRSQQDAKVKEKIEAFSVLQKRVHAGKLVFSLYKVNKRE